jgi:hypothetical protein
MQDHHRTASAPCSYRQVGYDARVLTAEVTFPSPRGDPNLRHLMWAVHEVIAADLRSVLVSAEAALQAKVTSSPRSVVVSRTGAVHAAVPWTRARRVGTPGPSSWST